MLLLLKAAEVYGQLAAPGTSTVIALGTFLHAGATRFLGEGSVRPVAKPDVILFARINGTTTLPLTARYEPGGRMTVAGTGAFAAVSFGDFGGQVRLLAEGGVRPLGGFNILGASDPINTRGFGEVVAGGEAGKLAEAVMTGSGNVRFAPSGVWNVQFLGNGASPAIFDAHPLISISTLLVGGTDLVGAGRLTLIGDLDGWTNVGNIFNAGEEVDLAGYVYG